MELIDFHSHLHPSLQARANLLEKMDQLGISKTCVIPGTEIAPIILSKQMHNPQPMNIDASNEEVRLLCAEKNGRLLPFYFANPLGTTEEYLREGRKYHGLKIGPVVHGVPLVDPKYIPFLEGARKFNHSVYLHCLAKNGFLVDSLLEIARDYSDLHFVLGHAGIGNCDFSAVAKIKDMPNIYFETSGGFSSVIEFAVKELGIDRILFGSEYPLQAPELEIAKIELLKLDTAKLNENALRLIGARHE